MIAALAEAALRSFALGGVVWIGLILFRVRNPHVHMTAWTVVLLASLAMPFVMHWPTLTLDRLPLSAPVLDDTWPADLTIMERPQLLLPIASGAVIAPIVKRSVAIDWWMVATTVYACVAGLLLLRLAIGLFLTWRLARAAKPVKSMIGADVRVSRDVGGPVTFGSTILVPPQFFRWDAKKRLAVLAHEGAHVANRDFYILLLASLNRVVFWFSPFSWWQISRLAELAEIISDARAIEMIDDRFSYAEILIDVAASVKPRPMELAMAQASTVRARVERIIAAAAQPVAVGWRKRLWIAAAIVPVMIVSAGMIAYRTPDPVPSGADVGHVPAAHYRPQVNFYAMSPTSVFAIFREGDELYGQLTGQRRLRLTIGNDGMASYAASFGEITFPLDAERRASELTLHMHGRDVRAVRVAEMPAQTTDPVSLDQYVGWYRIAPNRVLTVRRDGDRLQVQETGQGGLPVLSEGIDAFSLQGDHLLIFLRAEGGVANVLVQNAASGARIAQRIDAAAAQAIEADYARRLAEVPDRFREQVPVAGSKEIILRGIEDLRLGKPNYDRMSAPLAAKIHRQVDELRATFVALGAVETIFFRGVGPGGYDIYGAKFENGTAEFRLLLEPDGKAGDVIFRADGNDELGGIVPCSEEASVRGRAGTSPIRIMLYNETEDDISVFNLDANGERKAQSIVRSDMSWAAQTTVDNPWVIADKSGKCMEIVVPGRQTRFLNVEAATVGTRPGHAARRAVPIANGEAMLRHYIEGIGRGLPDYDHMTTEVANIARQQLPFDQAILARLGALRAVSFRGVTALDSDIYVAQFANGAAEWRIGVRNGTITKIALGPNF